jgi:DNA-binding NtrC family response regulator
VVAATLRDLRAAVAAGHFRDDLYYRIGRPEVRLPPLRHRLEDIPYLVAQAVARYGVPAHPSLVEACLLRPWPGNVRELLAEVARAAHAAVETGRPQARAEELDAHAGVAHASATRDHPGEPARPKVVSLPDEAGILDALTAEGGNVSRAARRLGVHRNQLRRYLAKHPKAAALAAGDATGSDDIER